MFTDDMISRATDMYFLDLLTQQEICVQLGYPSQATLSRWVREDRRYGVLHVRKKAGEPARPTAKYPFETRLLAVRMAEEGRYSQREISDRLGLCGHPMVAKWLKIAREKGYEALMTRDDRRRQRDVAAETEAGVANTADDIEELRRQNAELRLDKAVLEGTIEILKKDPGVDPSGLSNREKALLADALRAEFGLPCALERLSMPRSSYYYQKAAMTSPDKYAPLRERIKEIFAAEDRTYGSLRIWGRLRTGDAGHDPVIVSEKVVRRIMAEEGLLVVFAKKPKRHWSSYAGETGRAPENLVKRVFHADAPNKLWLTDITEFSLPFGKSYLSPVIDCFDGMVVAWKLSRHPTGKLATDMLEDALATVPAGHEVVCHSDRGLHYRTKEWIRICRERGVVRSMSKKGCSPDNSACEGFFGRLKNEFFYYRDWDGIDYEAFAAMLGAYIERYNNDRIKQSLGWKSPAEYRRSLGLAA